MKTISRSTLIQVSLYLKKHHFLLENFEYEPSGKGRRKRKRRSRSSRSRRERKRIHKLLSETINWQADLRRNSDSTYDVLIGTSSDRVNMHQMDQAASYVGEGEGDRPQYQNQREHIGSNATANAETPISNCAQETCVRGLANTHDGAVRGAEEESRDEWRSNSACRTDTFFTIFNTVPLSGFEDDEIYQYEWLRLKTFADWPINSIFSTTLARNGWVALGQGDRARCYSCHVVHRGWKVWEKPEKYHAPSCRFIGVQSNNIPIFRGSPLQVPAQAEQQQNHTRNSYAEMTSLPVNNTQEYTDVENITDRVQYSTADISSAEEQNDTDRRNRWHNEQEGWKVADNHEHEPNHRHMDVVDSAPPRSSTFVQQTSKYDLVATEGACHRPKETNYSDILKERVKSKHDPVVNEGTFSRHRQSNQNGSLTKQMKSKCDPVATEGAFSRHEESNHIGFPNRHMKLRNNPEAIERAFFRHEESNHSGILDEQVNSNYASDATEGEFSTHEESIHNGILSVKVKSKRVHVASKKTTSGPEESDYNGISREQEGKQMMKRIDEKTKIREVTLEKGLQVQQNTESSPRPAQNTTENTPTRVLETVYFTSDEIVDIISSVEIPNSVNQQGTGDNEET